MAGILKILDVNKQSEIYSDYLGQVNAESETPEGIAWIKNVGDNPFANVTVKIEQFSGNDGYSFMEIGLGTPLPSPTNLIGNKQSVAGSISENTTRHYRVAALGVSGGPTIPTSAITLSTVAGENGFGFFMSWVGVPNALGYVIYVSSDGVNFIEKATTLNINYLDQDGIVPTVGDTPVSQNQAFRANVFSTDDILIGNLDPDSAIPVFYRASIPAGASPAGNRRRARISVKGYTF